MDPQYPTAPELPGKAPVQASDPKQAAPQLVRSTRPPAPEPPEVEEEFEEPDELNEHVESPGDPDGLLAAEEEREYQQQHPVLPSKPKKKRRWPIVLLVLLLVAGAAFAAYKFGTKKAAAPTKEQQAKSSQDSTAKEAETASVPTKHYDSVTYTLGFDYPQDWAVSDTEAKLTVTSPSIKLKKVDGSSTGVNVVVTIQNPQTSIPGYPASGAIAALTSDKLTYKQPTAVQRAQTYLTYLSYKSTGLDALYITGDNGYQQGQNIPMSDIVKGNPLVGVTFQTCSTIDCVHGTVTPITLDATAWKDSAASKQVTALLQSMQLN
jgi:hypothetical protein